MTTRHAYIHSRGFKQCDFKWTPETEKCLGKHVHVLGQSKLCHIILEAAQENNFGSFMNMGRHARQIVFAETTGHFIFR